MSSGRRLVALDGVRGVAVLLVVLGHISGTWAPYAGNVGVTLFLVLSGYLITSLLLRERDRYGSISFTGFYMRRVLRLMPALLLVLAVTPILLWIATDARLETYGYPAVVSGLYLADFFQASGVNLGFFTHMWSLAVEEQFYLIWPLLLVGLLGAVGWGVSGSRRRLVAIVASLAFVGLAWRVVATLILDADRVYYAPDTNAFIILLGCLLAVMKKETITRVPRWLAVAALAVIAVASVLLPEGSPIVRNWTVLGAALLAVVVVAGSASGGRLLSAKPLVWFGTISYGLYLWHAVLLWIAWWGPEAAGLPRLGLAAISIVIAWASFRFYELPIQQRFKARWERPRVVGTGETAVLAPSGAGAV
ncbi:acyltransferase family protein [Microbacterium oryzae]|uniref:Acyltransferase n=1 Tax=Microbacterium oryzae TaxID=743009 RepID=A0A6I6E8H3_9MICO|nr:acyltransferase [Microbacterium oryzae]QGU27488.1 acyltransferase [Microbacterium oryzae]